MEEESQKPKSPPDDEPEGEVKLTPKQLAFIALMDTWIAEDKGQVDPDFKEQLREFERNRASMRNR